MMRKDRCQCVEWLSAMIAVRASNVVGTGEPDISEGMAGSQDGWIDERDRTDGLRNTGLSWSHVWGLGTDLGLT